MCLRSSLDSTEKIMYILDFENNYQVSLRKKANKNKEILEIKKERKKESKAVISFPKWILIALSTFFFFVSRKKPSFKSECVFASFVSRTNQNEAKNSEFL